MYLGESESDFRFFLFIIIIIPLLNVIRDHINKSRFCKFN